MSFIGKLFRATAAATAIGVFALGATVTGLALAQDKVSMKGFGFGMNVEQSVKLEDIGLTPRQTEVLGLLLGNPTANAYTLTRETFATLTGGSLDEEKWKNDARHDGRGHCLSSYDGHEHEVKVDGEWFYIYRVN